MQYVEEQTPRLRTEEKTIDEMWQFIDSIIKPYPLVVNRSSLTYQEVFKIYTRLSEIDQIFKEFEQIQMIKKALEKDIEQD